MRLLLLINTYVLSRTVSELLQLIGQIFAFDRGYTYVKGEPINSASWNLASRN